MAAAIGLVASIGGAFMQMRGAQQSAEAARAAAAAQAADMMRRAQIADMNAGFAKQAAEEELKKGESEITTMGVKVRQLAGTQRAALAFNIGDIYQGQAADVRRATKITRDLDFKTLTENAVRQAWGQNVRATNFEQEAQALRASAGTIDPDRAYSATMMGGMSGVLGSIGNIFSRFG